MQPLDLGYCKSALITKENRGTESMAQCRQSGKAKKNIQKLRSVRDEKRLGKSRLTAHNPNQQLWSGARLGQRRRPLHARQKPKCGRMDDISDATQE